MNLRFGYTYCHKRVFLSKLASVPKSGSHFQYTGLAGSKHLKTHRNGGQLSEAYR